MASEPVNRLSGELVPGRSGVFAQVTVLRCLATHVGGPYTSPVRRRIRHSTDPLGHRIHESDVQTKRTAREHRATGHSERMRTCCKALAGAETPTSSKPERKRGPEHKRGLNQAERGKTCCKAQAGAEAPHQIEQSSRHGSEKQGLGPENKSHQALRMKGDNMLQGASWS